jgi:hypothetical protein
VDPQKQCNFWILGWSETLPKYKNIKMNKSDLENGKLIDEGYGSFPVEGQDLDVSQPDLG